MGGEGARNYGAFLEIEPRGTRSPERKNRSTRANNRSAGFSDPRVGCTYIHGLEGRRRPSAGDRVSNTYRFPGIPFGWYTIAESKDVQRGQVETVKYFGEELILYRTESGEARLTGAYCPHLGAHLGRGKVAGENLQCAFHGFQFDGDGRCVHAYGKSVPRKAKLDTWAIREHNGFIFAWYHPEGAAPSFEIPVLPGPEAGWTAFKTETRAIASHPQETSENSVDVGHFSKLHTFSEAWYEGDLAVEGPILRGKYGLKYPLPFDISIKASFDVAVYGLGYSLVKITPSVGPEMHLLVLSSPVDNGNIVLRTSLAVRHGPVKPFTYLVRLAAYLAISNEISQDAPIWESKRYLDRPLLAEGDGPIGEYRRYCKQFYVDTQPTTAQRDKLPVVAA
jgi:nitrite reductase/ring-hydroxylating ferredoxin subunit